MIIVVTGHLLAVDVAMTAPAVCLWLQWRGRREPFARRLDQSLLKLSLAALGAAVPLGIAAAGLVWIHSPMPYGEAFSMLPRRRYQFGVVELVFSAGALWLAIRLGGRAEDGREASRLADRRCWFVTRWLATLLASLNLIYHFPPLFIMLGVLSTRPEAWGEPARFTTLLADPEVLARLAHHLLAAVVVTGTAMAWLAATGRLERPKSDRDAGAGRGDPSQPSAEQRGASAADALPAAVWGGRMAVAALLLQVLSGIMLVAEMPASSQQAILGHDALAAGLFAAALVAVFFVLPRLAATALGHVNPRHLTGSLWLVIAVMLLMTAAQQRTRELLFP